MAAEDLVGGGARAATAWLLRGCVRTVIEKLPVSACDPNLRPVLSIKLYWHHQ
jgi:hypothetical protein